MNIVIVLVLVYYKADIFVAWSAMGNICTYIYVYIHTEVKRSKLDDQKMHVVCNLWLGQSKVKSRSLHAPGKSCQCVKYVCIMCVCVFVGGHCKLIVNVDNMRVKLFTMWGWPK